MKKLIFICFLLCSFSLYALNWPVSEIKPISFFGQRNDGNSIERGLVLDHSGIIRASDDGIILFKLEESKNMSKFPNTLGNAVMIYHDDDLMTVYSNLKSLNRLDGKKIIESSSIIADDVGSGWGKEDSFLFMVVDQKMKKLLNPLMLLPPLKDAKRPTIKDLVAISEQTGRSVSLQGTRSLKQGSWHLFAEISDTIDNSLNVFAPFRISTIINGKEVLTLAFEVLTEQSGVLAFHSPKMFKKKLYEDPKKTYLGEIEFSRGRADIQIIVSDIASNERVLSFTLNID